MKNLRHHRARLDNDEIVFSRNLSNIPQLCSFEGRQLYYYNCYCTIIFNAEFNYYQSYSARFSPIVNERTTSFSFTPLLCYDQYLDLCQKSKNIWHFQDLAVRNIQRRRSRRITGLRLTRALVGAKGLTTNSQWQSNGRPRLRYNHAELIVIKAQRVS